MNIGFDFDGTLSNEMFGRFIQSISNNLNRGHTLILITSRCIINEEIKERVKELNLNINQFFAMGNTVYVHKADFVKEKKIKLDLFFDNDPYDVEAFSKNGILCIFIPPITGSLMEEICEEYILEKAKELDRIYLSYIQNKQRERNHSCINKSD